MGGSAANLWYRGSCCHERTMAELHGSGNGDGANGRTAIDAVRDSLTAG